MRRMRERPDRARAAILCGLRAWSIGTFGPAPMRSCQRPSRPIKVSKPYLQIGFVPPNEARSPGPCVMLFRGTVLPVTWFRSARTSPGEPARLHGCDKCGTLTAENTATGEAAMSSFDWRERVLASTLLAGLVWVAAAAPTAAQQKAVPDFSSGQFGWVGMGGGFGVGGEVFSPVAGQVPPVVNDHAHPYVPNGTKAQPTYHIADLSNPNLKPWV